MTDLHPIVPSEKSVLFLRLAAPPYNMFDAGVTRERNLITAAWSAGADAELEACLEWISKQDWTWTKAQLLAARRPKPLSEVDLALDALGPEPLPENTPSGYTFLNGGAIEGHRRIRRCLERLKKLEESTNV